MAKKRQYNEESMKKALDAVQRGLLSERKASKDFGVPRSSIQFKLKNPHTKPKSGPNPILTDTEEELLVKWLIDMSKRGFPRKKEDLKLCVQKFLKENPRPNPFIDDKPGNGWMKSFLKRHPIISERTSEGVSNASACVSESDIRKWFKEINEYISRENLEEVIKDPKRIFNADETGFTICPKTGKVLAEKGSKNVYEIEKVSPKENITVMFTFAANGLSLKPMVVYAYQRMPENVANSVPSGWGVSKSDKGWMTAPVFYEFIANVFYKQITEASIPLPVILFVDGHKSHVTIEVTELCKSLQIHLIALYPNATRILQPADVAAFRPLKEAWRKKLRDWYTETSYKIALNKLTFSPILEKVLETAIKPTTLVNGFKATGLFPFSPDQIDYSKCLSSSKTNSNDQANALQLPSTDMLLNYHQFCSLLGEDLISEVATLKELDVVTPEMKALQKVWLYFVKESNTEILLTESSVNETTPNLEQIHDEALTPTENSEVVVETKKMRMNTTYVITKNKDLIKQTETDILADISKTNINIISDEPLQTYLQTKMWPNSPKRKNKRNVEKLPFAMTSDDYIKVMKEKKDKKEKLVQEKLERQQKRQQKKLESDKKPKPKKTKTNKDKCEKLENNENLPCIPSTSSGKIHKIVYDPCVVCHKAVGINFVHCSNCKRNFHKRCVPINHQINIPEEEDDLFLCHMCYIIEDSDCSDNTEDIYLSILENKN